MKKSPKYYLYVLLASLTDLCILPILLIVAFCARFSKSKKSIFIGLMHVNNLTYVAQSLRQKGYSVQVVPWMIPDHEIDVIDYDVNIKREFPFLYSSFVGQYFLSFWLFIWAVFKFNLFVMPFRNRFFERTIWLKKLEIPLLHLANKTIFLNTYGGDVATPRLRRRKDLKYSLYDGYTKDPQYKVYDEEAISKNTRLLEKQADCIVSAIDHIDYLDRVDEYFHLRCIDTDKIHPQYDTNNKIPVFIHAPNHRQVKGTYQIIGAIESLNKRGIKCELKIVENCSNKELLKIISSVDAVIDQLLLGTYARLAIESMALGKPVFCYMRKDLYEFNPIWNHAPIINVNPEILEKELESFIESRKEDKHIIGVKGREFVERYHSLEYVGNGFAEIIKRYQRD